MKKFLILIPVLMLGCRERGDGNMARLMVRGQVPAASCTTYDPHGPDMPDVAVCAMPDGSKIISVFGGQIPFKAFPLSEATKKDPTPPTPDAGSGSGANAAPTPEAPAPKEKK